MKAVHAFPACLSLLILAVGATARAEDVVEVPPIEVTATAPPKPEAPASVRTDRLVEPEDLEAPEGPAAPLARLPSVQVLSAGGPGQSAMVAVRGSDPSATLATLDGVPLNSPYMGGADLAGMSLVTLDSLALVRGGRSAFHGTDAVGGVVAARTPDPLDGTRTRAALTVGSFLTGRLKASHVHTWKAGRNEVGMLVAGGAQGSDGTFPFQDTNGQQRMREHNGTWGFEGLARAAGRIDERHRVDLAVEGAWEKRQVGGLEQYPSATAMQWNTRAVVKAAWEGPQAFGRDGASWARLYYRRLGFAYDDPKPPLGPAIAATLVTHGVGGEAGTEGLLCPWFTLSGAVSASHDRGTTLRLGQPPESPSRTSVAGRVGGRFGGRSDIYGATVDARVEWDQGFGARVVPAAGAWVDPWGPLRLVANLSRGFRLPTLEELYFDAGFVQGNPDLVPEDSLTWDAGIELGHGKWWGLAATYFENRLRNQILFLPRSAFLVRAENSGGAVLRGGEFQARVTWRWLDASISYTYLDARFSSTGTTFPQRPAHVVHGTVGATVGPVRLEVMPGWRSGVFLDRFESLAEEARFRLDARLEWQFHEYVSIGLDALNLTDKRDGVDYLQRPLPGMSFFLTTRLDL